ncbi:MAG: hypothetical protein QNJ89_14450 [Acidimicrobiia bacterium]|nr:hypothetical protein [Acidimicrobiia bacterium]
MTQTNEERERKVRDALHRVLRDLTADLPSLDAVEDIPVLEDFVDDYAQARIADARAAGASWAGIAERLGVSRQAAHKRFAGARASDRRGPVFELRFVRSKD